MRLRKRDVREGLTVYEDKSTGIFYLKGKPEHLSFVLVSPTRYDTVLVDTGLLDEDDDPIIETKLRPITTTYLEKINIKTNTPQDEDEYDNELESEEETTEITEKDDDDNGRYLFMGSQQWLVYSTSDKSTQPHKFRKEIRFRLDTTFEKESEKKRKKAVDRISRNLPDIDSISQKDFKRKNKKVIKTYGSDDYLYF